MNSKYLISLDCCTYCCLKMFPTNVCKKVPISPRHLKINGTILPCKFFKRFFFYFIKTDSKMKINHLWEIKKLKKTILNNMQWILYQKRILKKKVVKFAQNCRFFWYFWNFKISVMVGNGRWLPENWPEGAV